MPWQRISRDNMRFPLAAGLRSGAALAKATLTDSSLSAADGYALSEARRLLLDPAGLDMPQLDRILASIHTHAVDFSDLYFQYSRTESWSLEEGIVKSGAFSIDRGVGIRAVQGEKQAFAYSDDITLAAMEAAAAAARAIGRQGSSGRRTAYPKPGRIDALRAPRPGRVVAGGRQGFAA